MHYRIQSSLLMDYRGTVGDHNCSHIQSEIHAYLHSHTHTYNTCVVYASVVYFMSVCVFNFGQRHKDK